MLIIVLIYLHFVFGRDTSKSADPECIEDFTLKCPEGWNLSLDNNGICVAPISYYGPCSSRIIATNNTKDKKILKSLCSVKWPCQEVCAKDFDICPKYWYKRGNQCFPTLSYSGPCHKPLNIEEIEPSERVLWSNRCNVKWSCKMDCKKDYKSNCPKDWTFLNDGRCKAPMSYTGPCFSIANLSYFNRNMKEDFEAICNAPFPCQ